MSYRDLRCRCCPSLNSFRVGRLIVCISPHPDLSAGVPTTAASVTTAAVFAPETAAAVVTPFLEAAYRAPESNPDPSLATGMSGDPANGGGEHEEVARLFGTDIEKGAATAFELTSLAARAAIDERKLSGTAPGVCAPEREIIGGANSVSDVVLRGSLPSGESEPPVTPAFAASEFKSSDGPASVSALEADWLRAPRSCGEARDDSTRNQLSMASRLTPPSPQDSNAITEADWLRAWNFNPAISSQPPSPVTAETSMHSEVSAFSFIDIPEFLPRKSSLLEMS